jgi:glycosyltransferase involved in cell wall biosynthesis
MPREKHQKDQQGQTPRFSVIVCTYNRCNLVLSLLTSLRRQTLAYDQFEVVVVDNGSSDGTLAAVRTYVSAGSNECSEGRWQVQCLSEPENGLAQARKTALQAALGEIAVFLDDDTLVDPHFLEHLLAAYEETGADAIGGRVELRWEASRPYWLTDELLGVLGYYAPALERMRLEEPAVFSSSNFSLKIEALEGVGYFSPLLSKRLNMPMSMEVYDLCRRLHRAGRTLWYEPAAVVVHRTPGARLVRPYFVGRAYWQGRSEVLAQYIESRSATGYQFSPHRISSALREVVYLALVQRPLYSLIGRPTHERLAAAMEQARNWGRVQQFRLLRHSIIELTAPAVLLVHSTEPDATVELLAHALSKQRVRCTTEEEKISLTWLWQNRVRKEQEGGILHFYRAGAFNLSYGQRLRFRFGLSLARRLGIRVVSSDTGGWWQQTHNIRFRWRRALEHKLLTSSDVVLAWTRQPDRLYLDKQLRQRVRCLPHPGFRGYYALPVSRTEAFRAFGLPEETTTVYLCFTQEHTEQEIVLLIEAFQELKKGLVPGPQLLLAGPATERQISKRVLKLAALNSRIHLSTLSPGKEHIPLYIGAVDVVVMPHFAIQAAGTLGTAYLALSFERVVVAPNLPRFRGMLPPRACILYDPTSKASLVRALEKAQKRKYYLNEKELATLDAERSWDEYAQRLLKIYRKLGRS